MGDTSHRLAAIYARLSVDRDGKKVGIDTQVADSRAIAAERGWEVVGEYVDRDLTAADRLVTRPEYDRLVEDFNAGKFTALVCWDLDRLTRQPRQLEDWIDAAEHRQVDLVTANGEADLSKDGGRLYARVKVAVAKGETERASARQKRSKQARREAGQWHGGPAPYGYRLDPEHKRLVVEPREAERVHEAVRRLLEDRETMHSIVVDWNNRGITTRHGKHWRQSNLRTLLLNQSLIGQTKAGVNGWKPILDQRTFDRLQALLTDPARKITHSPGIKTQRLSMGGGLTVCGKCGKPLVTNTKTRAGGKQSTLACLARTSGPSEHHPKVERLVTRAGEKVKVWQDSGRVAVDHDALEAYVFGQVIERLNATERWRQRMSEVDPAVGAAIDDLEAERNDLRAQRERAGKAFVLGVMSERDAQAEVTGLDVQLDDLDRRINELLGRPMLAEALSGGEDLDWKSWTPGRRRTFLRLLIDRVEIGDWPEGVTRRLVRFRGESAERQAERQREHVQNVMAQRARIVWLDEALPG